MINEVAIIKKKRVDERGNLSGEIKIFKKGGENHFDFHPLFELKIREKTFPSYFPKRTEYWSSKI